MAGEGCPEGRVNKDVRRAVFERENGACACGCGKSITEETGHLDHAFGRAKADEAVSNCWFLHPSCDHAKTTNSPSASYWLVRFVRHAAKHGYKSEEDRALTKLEALAVKKLSA